MDQSRNIEQQEIEEQPIPPQTLKLETKEYSDIETPKPISEGEALEKLIGIGVSSEVYLITSPKESLNNSCYSDSSPQKNAEKIETPKSKQKKSVSKKNQYIIKKFHKKWSLQDIEREGQLQQKAESDFVVKVIQIENRSILMEYASNGELLEYVKREKFSEKLARTYFLQLVQGMEKLHAQGIAHRDIKLDNLLLSENFQLKIADFGWATEYSQNQLLSERAGTEVNLAPEIIDYKAYVPEKIDVFACGIVLFQLVVGQSPINTKARKTDKIYKYFANNMTHKIWKQLKDKKNLKVSDEFKNLIELMINFNYKQRPTFKQILQHEWFKKGSIYTEQKELKQQMQSIYVHESQLIQAKKIPQNLKLININNSFNFTDSNSITNYDSPFSPEKSYSSHYNYNVLNLTNHNSSFNNNSNNNYNNNKKISSNNTNPFHSSNFSYNNSIFANYNMIQPQESQDYKALTSQFQNTHIQNELIQKDSSFSQQQSQEEEEIKEM
ncbi:Protein kinase-like domain [Pseudocohnilembus persalinus]|uniref:Protein kinase-like domain n=1 Tax=Pseudocohnilembus persalinus TaxID=266149 RepID=A0A0V0R7J3_PSEPJ|nr:Protein kinase-like domain [Pseudocohnilembus persalinus]|eukprot:KRX10460.1 Protein kinase-like domain [Pseudocohnilembus persalinus]